jgi:hypothetical protein
MSQGKHAIVREFRGRAPVAGLAHLFHRLPQRENFRMLMRDLEATILPCKYLDEARRLVSVVSLQRHPGLLVYQAEFSECRPVTLEQRDEVILAPDSHAIGTHDNLIVGFRHGRYLALLLNDNQDFPGIARPAEVGAPCGIRTHGPRIRNPVLYPSELRGRPDREKVTPMHGPGKGTSKDAISRGLALLYKSLVELRYLAERSGRGGKFQYG